MENVVEISSSPSVCPGKVPKLEPSLWRKLLQKGARTGQDWLAVKSGLQLECLNSHTFCLLRDYIRAVLRGKLAALLTAYRSAPADARADAGRI